MQIRAAQSADAGPMAHIHVDAWRATYADMIPADYLAGLSYRDRTSWWVRVLETPRRAVHHFVAETDGGQIMGFAGAGPERDGNCTYRGELYNIYLLPRHQGKGVGSGLVSAVAQRLLEDGIRSMLVWVLQDNQPACRFYESLGGGKVGRKTIEIGGVHLVEVSYGWKDITALGVERAAGLSKPRLPDHRARIP